MPRVHHKAVGSATAPSLKKKITQSPDLPYVPDVMPSREAAGQEEAQEKDAEDLLPEDPAEDTEEEATKVEQEEDKRRTGKPERCQVAPRRAHQKWYRP